MAASRSTLRAYDLAGKGRDFDIVGIGRYVDEALMPARIAEAGGDKMMHAEMAHVAERHRLAWRLPTFHFCNGAGLYVVAGHAFRRSRQLLLRISQTRVVGRHCIMLCPAFVGDGSPSKRCFL